MFVLVFLLHPCQFPQLCPWSSVGGYHVSSQVISWLLQFSFFLLCHNHSASFWETSCLPLTSSYHFLSLFFGPTHIASDIGRLLPLWEHTANCSVFTCKRNYAVHFTERKPRFQEAPHPVVVKSSYTLPVMKWSKKWIKWWLSGLPRGPVGLMTLGMKHIHEVWMQRGKPIRNSLPRVYDFLLLNPTKSILLPFLCLQIHFVFWDWGWWWRVY